MIQYRADKLSFQMLLRVQGCGTLVPEKGIPLLIFKGDCIFFPADSAEVRPMAGHSFWNSRVEEFGKKSRRRGGSLKMKKALITGITGQDGSFLAELLLEKGYEVHGIVRCASVSNTERIDHLLAQDSIILHNGDLTDSLSLTRIIAQIQPDEIYNLAAQSHVHVSFDVPEYSGDINAQGVLRILEAVRILGLTGKTRIYQASTSELYGKVEEVPQKETTPFHPYSPYAVAKQYGFWMVKEYREAYGMFAVNGILFNHESERRGENFVTRKITLAAGRIAVGLQDHLELGNLGSLRDWGYAKGYVECMWRMLQQDKPDDFIIATGEQHTVREFTEKAFAANGILLRWEGARLDEKGYDAKTGRMLVRVNPAWFRPTDVDNLLGDPTKARTVLDWNPQTTSFEKLVEIMAKHDRALAEQQKKEFPFKNGSDAMDLYSRDEN